jgi:hypothetical protein
MGEYIQLTATDKCFKFGFFIHQDPDNMDEECRQARKAAEAYNAKKPDNGALGYHKYIGC